MIANPMAKSLDPVQNNVMMPNRLASSPGCTCLPVGRVTQATNIARVKEHTFTMAQEATMPTSTVDKSNLATLRKINRGKQIFPTMGPMPLLALAGMNPVSFPTNPKAMVKKIIVIVLTKVDSVSAPTAVVVVLVRFMVFVSSSSKGKRPSTVRLL